MRQVGRLTLDDVKAEVAQRLGMPEWESIQDDLIDSWVTTEDKRRVQLGASSQLLLWTGDGAALDGYWKLGGANRVLIRLATFTEYQQHLGYVADNAAKVNAAAAKKQQEAARLSPYFTTALTTVAEAVAAYFHDHPAERQ